MKKTIAIYGLAIAGFAVLLQWLEYQYAVRLFTREIYLGLVALLFASLGVWVGLRLRGGPPAPTFERNVKAAEYLGISEREVEVLELVAEGCSNKEIGEKLFVSPNTVKTHLRNLYGKLEVSRRTQAIQKARALGLIR